MLFETALIGSGGAVARGVPDRLNRLIERIGNLDDLASGVVVAGRAFEGVGDEGGAGECAVGVFRIGILERGVGGEGGVGANRRRLLRDAALSVVDVH